MQIAVQKLNDLRDLLISCTGMDEAELRAVAKRTFDDAFLDSALRGSKETHDGQEVVFYPDRFEHTYCMKADRSKINVERYQRIHWVLPMINGRVPNSQCWLQKEIDCEKRIYVCNRLGYIVFLRSRDTCDGWTFRTAFNADGGYLRKCVKGGQLLAKF